MYTIYVACSRVVGLLSQHKAAREDRGLKYSSFRENSSLVWIGLTLLIQTCF